MASSAPLQPAGETREAILAAALEAFSQQGFAATSTRDIVRHRLVREIVDAYESKSVKKARKAKRE